MTDLGKLEFLDAIVWSEVRNGMTALATKHFLNQQFYGLPEEERKKIYKTNVANNFLYMANQSVIECSIIGLVENIREQKKRDPIDIDFPDLEELRKHRVVISHPANIKFSDPTIQKFFDDRKQYRDPTAVRLWRSRNVLLDKLTSLGSKQAEKFPNDVVVQSGTVELIQVALNLSLQTGQPTFTLEEIWQSVPEYFKRYEEGIKKFAIELKP